jgi:hypothetical protein
MDISAKMKLKHVYCKVIVSNCEHGFLLSSLTDEHGDNMCDCNAPHFSTLINSKLTFSIVVS